MEFGNGEFMGKKLTEPKRVPAAAVAINGVRRRVCMSLTTNVAIGDAAVMFRTLQIFVFFGFLVLWTLKCLRFMKLRLLC